LKLRAKSQIDSPSRSVTRVRNLRMRKWLYLVTANPYNSAAASPIVAARGLSRNPEMIIQLTKPMNMASMNHPSQPVDFSMYFGINRDDFRILMQPNVELTGRGPES